MMTTDDANSRIAFEFNSLFRKFDEKFKSKCTVLKVFSSYIYSFAFFSLSIYYKGLRVKVHHEGQELDGILFRVKLDNGIFKFDVRYTQWIVSFPYFEPNHITVPDDVESDFRQFLTDLNACMNEFNERILGE